MFKFLYRDSIVLECLQCKVTESLSTFTDDRNMYHSKKSDLLNRLRQIHGAVVELVKSDRSAIVFDLSVFIKALANRNQ